jgi:hypothetical protein
VLIEHCIQPVVEVGHLTAYGVGDYDLALVRTGELNGRIAARRRTGFTDPNWEAPLAEGHRRARDTLLLASGAP